MPVESTARPPSSSLPTVPTPRGATSTERNTSSTEHPVHTTELKLASVEAQLPSGEDRPTVLRTRSPNKQLSNHQPASREQRTANFKLPSANQRQSSSFATRQSSGGRPSSREGRPPSTNDRPLSTDERPPSTNERPPSVLRLQTPEGAQPASSDVTSDKRLKLVLRPSSTRGPSDVQVLEDKLPDDRSIRKLNENGIQSHSPLQSAKLNNQSLKLSSKTIKQESNFKQDNEVVSVSKWSQRQESSVANETLKSEKTSVKSKSIYDSPRDAHPLKLDLKGIHSKGGKSQVARSQDGNCGELYTPRSRHVVNGTRRTVSWSHVPRGPASSGGYPSRATTPRSLRSLPGIPWGQLPGLSGTRVGTISPIDSERCITPSAMLPRGHDYIKRAKLVTKVLFTEAARLSRSFALCFNYTMTDRTDFIQTARVGPNVRPRLGTTDVFDVHLVLRPPIPSEAFEIMSVLPRDAPPGNAVARLNPSLTPAERVCVKKTWGPLLLEGEYLIPGLVHQCVNDAVELAIGSLDKIHIGQDLYGVIPASSPPQLTLMVSYVNLDSTSNTGESSFTIHIVPVIIAAGIPRISGFQLRMPIPHILPWSRVGAEVMREFDEEVQDWTLFWRLEGRYVAQEVNKKKPAVPGFLQGVLTKRTQLKKQKQEQQMAGPLPLQPHLRYWVMSFEPLESRLLDLCLSKDIFAMAREAFEVFDEMIPEFGEAWGHLPVAMTTSVKLWTIYKTAVKNKTLLNWLSALLMTIFDCLKQKSCSFFLLPRINMLRHVDKGHLESLTIELKELLKAKNPAWRYKAKAAGTGDGSVTIVTTESAGTGSTSDNKAESLTSSTTARNVVAHNNIGHSNTNSRTTTTMNSNKSKQLQRFPNIRRSHTIY